MNRAAKYTTLIVVVHLLVNIAHGLAHRELRVDLTLLQAAFVGIVVLASPLIAMGVVWTGRRKLGLILLSASMLGSLLFGLYHHFLVVSPDHVHAQPANVWGAMFIVTAYGLFLTEAIGTYCGIYFVRLSTQTTSQSPESLAR